MTVQMHPVQSSHISAAGYDPATSEFHVSFKSGGSFKLMGVPAKVAAEFASARSKGSFFALHMRGKYRHEKLSEQQASATVQ